MPLTATALLTTSAGAEESGVWNEVANAWSDWSGLARDLLGLFFVVVGISMLLYNHVAMHAVWRQYTNERFATAVDGDVLDSEPSDDGHAFHVSVLYTTTVHKFEHDYRQKFRQPSAVEPRRFLRRFRLERPLPRGAALDVLVLHGLPRSGCLREVVDGKVRAHSHCRTLLLGVPGAALAGTFLYLALLEAGAMEAPTTGYLVVAAGLAVILLGTHACSWRRFQREKRRALEVAVAMKAVAGAPRGGGAASRAEPLLPSPERVPRYKTGMAVLYKSSGTIASARILEVHADDECVPYYTLRLEDGREKQTDNDHIALDPWRGIAA